VISSSQRPLPARHTTNTRDEHHCPQRVSKPRNQQSSGFRHKPNANGIGPLLIISRLYLGRVTVIFFFLNKGHTFSYKTSKIGHILTHLTRYHLLLLIYIKWWQFHFNSQQFCVVLLLQPLLIIFTDSAEIFRSLKDPFSYFNSNYAYCTKKTTLNSLSLTFPVSSSSFYNILTLWEKLVVSSVFEAVLKFIEFPGHACCINNGFLITKYCVIKLVRLFLDK